MATIKLKNTKSANRLISYAEGKAVERDGFNCVPEYAKSQFLATRSMYGKNDSIQAHHVIQSFKPGEVSPDVANALGMELAQKIAKGYECAVYTHSDRNHIHNHIVINSVGFDDGKKFHLHGKKGIEKVRKASDEICKQHELSVVKEKTAALRYTQAEQGIINRQEQSWKNDIRNDIEEAQKRAEDWEDYKKIMTEEKGYKMREGKYVTYTHPDNENWKVRDNKLGLNYERSTIENGIRTNDRQDERTIAGSTEGNAEIKRSDEKLHDRADGQGERQPVADDKGNVINRGDEQQGSVSNDFDFVRARERAEEIRKKFARNHATWGERAEANESSGDNRTGQDKNTKQSGHERAEPEREPKLGRDRGFNGFER